MKLENENQARQAEIHREVRKGSSCTGVTAVKHEIQQYLCACPSCIVRVETMASPPVAGAANPSRIGQF